MRTAWEMIQALLGEGETMEVVVFGPDPEKLGYGRHVPPNKSGCALRPTEAKEFLLKFDALSDIGRGDYTPFYLWTNQRVFWIHEYDGATRLAWVPRNPTACHPEANGEGREEADDMGGDREDEEFRAEEERARDLQRRLRTAPPDGGKQ